MSRLPKIPAFARHVFLGVSILGLAAVSAVAWKSLGSESRLEAAAAEHDDKSSSTETADEHDAPVAKSKPAGEEKASHARHGESGAERTNEKTVEKPVERGGERGSKRTAATQRAQDKPAERGERSVPAKGHEETSGPSLSPDELWADLEAGNKRFVSGKTQPRELVNLRASLAKGQHPQVIVIGCADSRCSPELVFDKNLGELFVVRTAGNIADPIALGSIEYAAEHIHAKVLVVLGHDKCGAVAAAAGGGKLPSPNLEAIVGRIAPALEDLRAEASGEELVRKGVAANVHQSADDIIRSSRIIRNLVMSGKLRIIKAVYHLETGEVERL